MWGVIEAQHRTGHVKGNDNIRKLTCESSDDSDQLGNPSSLIRVFIVSSVDGYYPKCLFFFLSDSDY